MGKWDGGYLTITNVRIEENEIFIHFENGNILMVPKSKIDENNLPGIHWEEIRIDGGKTGIIIPTDFPVQFGFDLNKFIVVPAFWIREITDEHYKENIEKMGLAQKKHFGNRVKELREKKGLSREAIVRICNIVPEELIKIEEGNYDTANAPVTRILEAMGHSLLDLHN